MSQVPYFKDGQFQGSIEVEPGETCRHPHAESTGETCAEGCCNEYRCLDCGKTFMLELPD